MSLLDEALRDLAIKNELKKPESLHQLFLKKINDKSGFDELIEKIENLDLEVFVTLSSFLIKTSIKKEIIYISTSKIIPQLLHVTKNLDLIINGVKFDSLDVVEIRCPPTHDKYYLNLSKLISVLIRENDFEKWIDLKNYYKESK